MSWCPPKAKTHRVRGFAPYTPRGDAKALLDDVQAVLAAFAAFLPLTVRQIFYRLVATTGFPKSERAYKRLAEILVRARRGGLVSWDAIRDDGFHKPGNLGWDGPADVVAAFERTIDGFTLDRQTGQPRRTVVWCEAGGMVPQLNRVCADLSVPVYSSGGFDSVTVKHQLASEFAAMGDVVVFHIGADDRDSNNTSIGRGPAYLAARLRHEHNLPTSPPKATDRRAFDGDTVQAEALPPDVLASVVRDAIDGSLDALAFQGALELERMAKQRLASWWASLPEPPS